MFKKYIKRLNTFIYHNKEANRYYIDSESTSLSNRNMYGKKVRKRISKQQFEKYLSIS
jgi:hypothetical protein